MNFLLANVKEHAPLSARAHVDHGVEVITKEDHENRKADRGCVSRLVSLLHLGDYLLLSPSPARSRTFVASVVYAGMVFLAPCVLV